MVGVERVNGIMREHEVRLEILEDAHQLLNCRIRHVQGIISQIETTKIRSDRGCRRVCLFMTNPLHILDGLIRLLPQLAGFASFAVRKRDHARAPALRSDDGNRSRRAPNEIGGVRSNHNSPDSPLSP